MMVKLINMKESLIRFYQKREDILRPLLKVLLSFTVLCLTQNIFGIFDMKLLAVILGASVIQAFLPLYMLFFTGSVLIAYNLWNISPDMCLGFVLLFLICLLTFVRMEPKTACIIVIVPVLFYLQLEYLIPVILGISLGFAGVFPAVFGTLIYYMMHYTGDASSLLINASETDVGTGLSRVINLMAIDRMMLILLVTFALVIFITAILYRLFYELAWLFSVTFGNAAMIFLMLCGRYIFELDFAIWRLFLEAVISVVLCIIIQFFRGIGDVSRMERTSFEDDDYIYYVKAVPKIRVARENPNVTDISSIVSEEELEMAVPGPEEEDGESQPVENGEMRRKRRAERKRIFGRKKKPDQEMTGKTAEDESQTAKQKAGKAANENKAAGKAAAKAADENKAAGKGADETGDSKAAAKPADETGDSKAWTKPADETGDSKAWAKPADEAGDSKAGAKPADEAGDSKAAAKPADEAGRDKSTDKVADESKTVGIPDDERRAGGKAADKPSFADAVISGNDRKIKKLDMEEIVRENIAAARELSASEGKKQGKES